MEYGLQQVQGKERPFIVGLLLTIVTLGIYPLYWHYKVHAELAGQLGRENKAVKVWIPYVILQVASLVLGIVFAVLFFAYFAETLAEQAEPTPEDLIAFFLSLGALAAVLLVIWIVSLVLFAIYVIRMYEQLGDATRRLNVAMRGGGSGAFFGLYFGGLAAGMVIPFLGTIAQLIMMPWAYFFLQETYNDVWRRVRAGEKLPSDAEWAAGPRMPPAGAPTAVGYGAPPGGWSVRPAPPQSGPTEYRPQATASAPSSTYARPTAPTQALVRQSFECPRCRAHIAAAGAPGARVEIRCSNCGEGGQVVMPAA